MTDTLLRLLPVIIGITAGFTLRRLKMVDHHDGETVFKLVFYVFLPALMFMSLSTVNLSGQFVFFPIAAASVCLLGFLAGLIVTRRAGFDPVATAVLLTACIIVNTGFALPFIQALYGPDGVARVAAYDAVGTTVAFTFAYYLAARGNPRATDSTLIFARLAKSPALYAIAAGLIVNFAGITLPAAISEPATKFGSATAVLIPVGIGIMFDPLGGGLRRAGVIVATRLASALGIAVFVVLVFGLHGMDRTIALLFGVAPLAFSTVTYASLESLDVRLATSAVSLSLVTSIVFSFAVVLLLT